jgi:uncharacterized delta-60 repeat protein
VGTRRLFTLAIATGALSLLAPGLVQGASEGPGTTERAIELGPVVEDLAATRGGRILAVGESHVFYQDFRDAGIYAFLPDGQVDSSFGEQGIAPVPASPPNSGGGMQLVPQRDGRLIVAEVWSTRFSPAGRRPVLRRLNADGSIDTTFGVNGVVTPNLGTESGQINDVAAEPGGATLVLGSANTDGADGLLVARHLPDGSPDLRFGHGGRAAIENGPVTGGRLALMPDGDVLVVATSDSGPRISSLDASGDTATRMKPLPLARASVASLWAGSVAPVVLGDGRVRVPGYVLLEGERSWRMAVAGLTAVGEPDRAYGRDGLAVGPPPPGPREAQSGEYVSDAALDRAGGLVLTGADFADFTETAVARRFNRDGTLDRSFGPAGRVAFGGPAGYFGVGVVGRVAVLPDGGVLASDSSVYLKYGTGGPTTLRWLRPGPDSVAPTITAGGGCRRVRVRIADASRLERVMVRARGRPIHRTRRARFSLHRPSGTRWIAIAATDVAGNRSVRRVLLPPC